MSKHINYVPHLPQLLKILYFVVGLADFKKRVFSVFPKHYAYALLAPLTKMCDQLELQLY